MRIVSRLNEDEMQLERLRQILEAATDGAISPQGNILPGETLPELVSQVDETCANFLETMDALEQSYDSLHSEVLALSAQCGAQEKIIDSLTDGIHYDDALDYATIDLMDALLGSGAANSTFDGDLSFEDGVVFTKEDLKPILRQAIDTWINLKVR